MKKRLYIITVLSTTLSIISLAQPAIKPAPGYKWRAVSTGTYTTGPQRTGCKSGSGACGITDNSFGLNLLCPSDLGSTVVAGCPAIQKQVSGNIGENGSNLSGLSMTYNPGCGGTVSEKNWPSSSTATRRVQMAEWTNANPESSVQNGSSTGMVVLPIAARIVIDNGSGLDGSSVGADELRFLVIGGVYDAQSTFTITANYQLGWLSSKYTGSGSTGNQTITQNLTVFNAGIGNNYEWAFDQPQRSWYYSATGKNVASFSTALQQTVALPVSSISQAGGSFTIDFTATASIDLIRLSGKADARVSMGPGFQGCARYEVDYQCWQIVANAL